MTGSEIDEIKEKILLAALKEYSQEFPSKSWVAIDIVGTRYKYEDAREALERDKLIEVDVERTVFRKFTVRLTEDGKTFCQKLMVQCERCGELTSVGESPPDLPGAVPAT